VTISAPIEIRLGFGREQMNAWIDQAMLEGEREQLRQRILRRIAARERRERDLDDVEERCRCGDPGARPPCSYCERGSRGT
jgi:hypothetical protein